MEKCKLLMMFSYVLWIVLITVEKTGTSCVLPQVLAQSQWNYNSQNVTTGQVNFGQTTMSGFGVNVKGNQLNAYTCISETANVYVFKSDDTYSDRGLDRRVYRCMKITEVTNNLVYIYFLSDLDTSASARFYSPPADTTVDENQATCNFCNYTKPPTAEEFFLMKRSNTDEKLTITPMPCLPCDADCTKDPCDPNPCQNGGSCTSVTDGYNCSCASGWKNKNCTYAVHVEPEKQTLHIAVIITIVIVAILVVIIIIFVARYCMRQRRNTSNKRYDVPNDMKAEFQNTE